MKIIRITKTPGKQFWVTSPGRFTPVRDPERFPQPDDSQRKVKRFYERDRPMA
jgi:hypothetical protein